MHAVLQVSKCDCFDPSGSDEQIGVPVAGLPWIMTGKRDRGPSLVRSIGRTSVTEAPLLQKKESPEGRTASGGASRNFQLKRPSGRRNRHGNHQERRQNNQQAEGGVPVAMPAA
jgi:hypothetical protein